ncbi:MAG: hypothetical protein Q9205_004038 [Flavoplaca limonia]
MSGMTGREDVKKGPDFERDPPPALPLGTFRLVLVKTARVEATSSSHDMDGGRRSVYMEGLVEE